MPCQSDYSPRDYEMGAKEAQAELKAQKDKTDELTEMLCILARHLEAAERSDLFNSTPNLKAWWIKHKKLDAAEAKRKATAAAKKVERKRLKEVAKAALAKLSPEERKALGVK